MREVYTLAMRITKVQFRQIIEPLDTNLSLTCEMQLLILTIATAKMLSEISRHKALSQIEIRNSQKIYFRLACWSS